MTIAMAKFLFFKLPFYILKGFFVFLRDILISAYNNLVSIIGKYLVQTFLTIFIFYIMHNL